MTKKVSYCIIASYSSEGCRKLLSEGGEARIQKLKESYSYLNLEILQYFWIDAGKKIFLVVECEDKHADDALGALKMQLFTSGYFEYLDLNRIYTAADIDNIKNIARVIE